MIKSNYLGFLIFASMMTIFYVLPDPEGIQKPFRILLGISFVFIYFALLINKKISSRTIWPIIIGGILVIIMILRGTVQTSFINAYLCLFGLLCTPHLLFVLTPIRKTNLTYIYILSIISIAIQFMIFSSTDGRPSLAYEINLSGAYLFLFFISSDILGNKFGKIFVIFLSLITLSRLLIFSILLFYLVHYLKKHFSFWLIKLSARKLAIASYIFISLFSVWYSTNIKTKVADTSTINRVVSLNDGSNQLRFLANTLVLSTIYVSPLSEKVLLGFGQYENFIKTADRSMVMPHNELFDSIAQFGIITVFFFSIFSLSIYNKVTSFDNIEYFIPLVFYTLILWVRFLLVPSFEMIFILFMLNLALTRANEMKQSLIVKKEFKPKEQITI